MIFMNAKDLILKVFETAKRLVSELVKPESDFLRFVLIAGVLLFAAGIVVAVLLLARRRRNLICEGIPLEAYLKQWGGKLPVEMSVHVIAPVLMQLASMHNEGHIHMDISPDRIIIQNTNQAVLLPPRAMDSGNYIVQSTGFAAPEQFKGDTPLGPWSDVYSIAGILYLMATGSRPQGVLQRKLDHDLVASALMSADVSDAHRAIIEAGLAIDPSQRIPNAFELMRLLNIEYFVANQPQMVTPKRIRSYKEKKAGKVVLIAAGVLIAIAIPSGIAMNNAYNQNHYELALSYVEDQKYNDAYDELTKIPAPYNDAEKLALFVFASLDLQNKEFDKAREGFEKLGDYRNTQAMIQEVAYQQAKDDLAHNDFIKARKGFLELGSYNDSAQMLLEVDYQEALLLLSEGAFREAEAAFTKLAQKNYQDASDQIKEVKYRWALSDFEQGRFSLGLRRMESISSYKDSSTQISSMKESIYTMGRDFYREHNYVQASACFNAIADYKESASYSTLIYGHQEPQGYYADSRDLYDALKALGNFEDVKDILVSNTFIYYELEGRWTDGKGNSLQFTYKKKEDYVHLTYDVPANRFGKYYKIENGSIFFGEEKLGWKKVFDLTFISDDELDVYCVKNDRVYHMKRR